MGLIKIKKEIFSGYIVLYHGIIFRLLIMLGAIKNDHQHVSNGV